MRNKFKIFLLISCPGLAALLSERWGRLWFFLAIYLLAAMLHATFPESWWSRSNQLFSLQVVAILFGLNWRDLFWKSFLKTKELIFKPSVLFLYFYCVAAISLLIIIAGPRLVMIDDESMYATLKKGDYVRYWSEPNLKWQRGDLALFIHPTEERKMFRRLVAFGGDFVATKEGIIYVNSIPMNASDLGALPVYNLPDLSFMVVPEGKVLWIAENKEDSSEKGTWGFAKLKDLRGRALWIQNSKDKEKIGMNLRILKNI